MSDLYLKLQDLVIELANKDPEIASEAGGDIHCFYCHAWIENDFESHNPDCIWLRANDLILEYENA